MFGMKKGGFGMGGMRPQQQKPAPRAGGVGAGGLMGMSGRPKPPPQQGGMAQQAARRGMGAMMGGGNSAGGASQNLQAQGAPPPQQGGMAQQAARRGMMGAMMGGGNPAQAQGAPPPQPPPQSMMQKAIGGVGMGATLSDERAKHQAYADGYKAASRDAREAAEYNEETPFDRYKKGFKENLTGTVERHEGPGAVSGLYAGWNAGTREKRSGPGEKVGSRAGSAARPGGPSGSEAGSAGASRLVRISNAELPEQVIIGERPREGEGEDEGIVLGDQRVPAKTEAVELSEEEFNERKSDEPKGRGASELSEEEFNKRKAADMARGVRPPRSGVRKQYPKK